MPKKSARPKRRYILFSLKQGFCQNSKRAFELVMACFSQDEKRALGTWFIGFDTASFRGILRCHLQALSQAKKCPEKAPGESGLKILRVSGTLKALKR